MSDTIKCQCSATLTIETREDGRVYLIPEDFEHLQEHYTADHKELLEQLQQTKIIEEFI